MTVDDSLLVLLDVVLERRWQLVSARQQTLCRIHDQLTRLIPGGAAKYLTADNALLRRIRPSDPVGICRRPIVRDLLAELRTLDRKIAPLDADIAWMLDGHGTTLAGLVGIGHTHAATILAIPGDPTRFRSAAAFTSSRPPRRSRHPQARRSGIGSTAATTGTPSTLMYRPRTRAAQLNNY